MHLLSKTCILFFFLLATSLGIVLADKIPEKQPCLSYACLQNLSVEQLWELRESKEITHKSAEKLKIDFSIISRAPSNHKDSCMQVYAYYSIAENYRVVSSLQKSIDMAKKGLPLCATFKRGRCQLYDRIAASFYELSELDSALEYANRANKLLGSNPDLGMQATKVRLDLLIAGVYTQMGKSQLAVTVLNEAYFLSQKADTLNIPSIQRSLAMAHEELGNFAKADSLYAISLAGSEAAGDANNMKVTLNEWASFKENRKDYKAAYDLASRRDGILQTMYDRKQNNLLSEIEAKHNNEKLELANVQLQKLNIAAKSRIGYQYGIIVMGIILLLGGALFGYNQQQQKKLLSQESRILAQSQAELQEQGKALLKLSKSQTLLISVVSHDFRTPFNSLQSTIELLKANALSGAERDLLLTSISEQVRTSLSMANDILLWAKSQMGGIMPVLIPLQLEQNVHKATQHLSHAAELKQVTIKFLHYEKQESLPPVLADSGSLDIVIRNILSNAIKFTPSGTEVTIAIFDADDKLGLSVVDQGDGISEQKISEITEFSEERVKSLRSNSDFSSGFGLVLVKDFLTAMGGSLEIQSQKGQGAKITFWLAKAADQTPIHNDGGEVKSLLVEPLA